MIVCSECKGKNIETKMWIDPNNYHNVMDSCSDGELEDNWCKDCGEHVEFEIKKSKKEIIK